MFKNLVVFSSLLLLLLLTAATALAVPNPPHVLEGYVLVDGVAPPDGTLVSVLINGTSFGTAITQTSAGAAGFYSVEIAADDPDTPAVEGGVNGDTVNFTVDGQPAAETTTFQVGAFAQLDLTVGDSTTIDAAFTCTPVSGIAPHTITCTDQSTGPVTSWTWYFGDGSGDVSQNPTYTFNTPGTYTVQLVVSDGATTDSTTQTIAVTSTDMNLSLSPDAVTVYPSSLSLDLYINNADNLYGTEASCTFDNTLLTSTSVSWPGFFDSDNFNVINTTADTIELTASQRHPAPELYGTDVVGTLFFDAQTPGTADVTCTWQFFNKEGHEIAGGVTTATITIESPEGDINGSFVYQLRSPQDNIAVTTTDGLGNTVTDAGGAFSLFNLPPSTYTVQAEVIGHLTYCEDATASVGTQTTMALTKLRAGDTDGDGDIDIDDALNVSTIFGTTSADLSRDFNANGRIDGSDLTALGGNYGLVTNCGP